MTHSRVSSKKARSSGTAVTCSRARTPTTRTVGPNEQAFRQPRPHGLSASHFHGELRGYGRAVGDFPAGRTPSRHGSSRSSRASPVDDPDTGRFSIRRGATHHPPHTTLRDHRQRRTVPPCPGPPTFGQTRRDGPQPATDAAPAARSCGPGHTVRLRARRPPTRCHLLLVVQPHPLLSRQRSTDRRILAFPQVRGFPLRPCINLGRHFRRSIDVSSNPPGGAFHPRTPLQRHLLRDQTCLLGSTSHHPVPPHKSRQPNNLSSLRRDIHVERIRLQVNVQLSLRSTHCRTPEPG